MNEEKQQYRMTEAQKNTARERGVLLPGEDRSRDAYFQPYIGGAFVLPDGGGVVEVLRYDRAEIGYYHNGACGPFTAGWIMPDGEWRSLISAAKVII